MTLDPTRVERRPADRDERWYLNDEREFLRRSLEDAAREHDAGDLSDEDHALLIARDAARLAVVEGELAGLDPSPAPVRTAAPAGTPPAPGARAALARWRWVFLVIGCLCILGAGVILVVHSVQPRQPGQASSGTVSVSQAQMIEQQLQQALTLNDRGNTVGALELYDKVLSEDPSNPAALAYAGYLAWNQGSAAHVASLMKIGRSEIQTAVTDSPSYYQGHLFYGLVLENQDHDHAAAVAQFNDFLADDPPAAELPQVAPLVTGAYASAGQPVPAVFASSTTSTTSSTP